MENKEQILTNLYSLRAGISAVAIQREDVEKINQQKCEGIADLQDEIIKIQKDKNDFAKQIEQINDEINESCDYINKNRNHRFPSKSFRNEEIVRSIFLPCGICFCLFIISVVSIYLIISLLFPTLPHNRMEIGILPVLAFVAIGGIGIFCFFKYLPNAIDGVKGEIIRYRGRINVYHNIEKELAIRYKHVKDLQATIENNKRKISNNEELIAKKQREIEQLKADAENDCVPHYQLGSLIQSQFEEQFKGFINLRDWQNVDIIIFAFESGRVENMKEALTYVDGENRTDRIVKAINDSSSAVCRSIQSGLGEIAKGMGYCFRIISSQIAEQTRLLDRISGNIQSISQGTAALAESTAMYSARVAELAEKVDYSNALQEQRNESSAKMAAENETFLLQAKQYMNKLYINM